MHNEIHWEFFAVCFGISQTKSTDCNIPECPLTGDRLIQLLLLTHEIKCYAMFECHSLLNVKRNLNSCLGHRSLEIWFKVTFKALHTLPHLS